MTPRRAFELEADRWGGCRGEAVCACYAAVVAVPEGKPVPRWLTAAASVTVVIDVVLGVLGFLWSPVLWLPGVVLSVIVTYAFIVVRGSAREWKG